jgi:hypothetical protein
VQSAPPWAQGDGRPESAGGTWRPDPEALGDFARALATRYDGTHPTLISITGLLPRVANFEAWNEVNLSQFLQPQWGGPDKRSPRSPDIYRDMLNAFHDNVHAAQPDAKVLATGLSPIGDGPASRSLRPLHFLRELLCLRGRQALEAVRGCEAPRFDVLSDHPIGPDRGPRVGADHPDNTTIADLDKIVRTIKAAQSEGTIEGRHPLWVTEYWWQTDPPRPDQDAPSPRKQARWIAEAQYSLWQQRVKVATLFQVIDDELDLSSPYASFHTGVFFHDGDAKPSELAARFPVAAKRKSRRKVAVWTRPPVDGQVRIEIDKGGGWRRAASFDGEAGTPKRKVIRLRGAARIRAAIGDEFSYEWKQRGR